jgi:uncharacterized membrane protein YesL
MGRFFDLDSPMVQALGKMADLMWLNLLVIFTSLPIFTFGAAITAAHYVALKIKRGEEGYVTKDFFRSFKEIFKQSTIIWLLTILVIVVILGDIYIMFYSGGTEIASWIQVLVMAAGILVIFTLMWVFALQAKFSNAIKVTIKNAFAVSVWQFPKTVLMVVASCVPVAVCLVSMAAFPIVFMFCFTFPVYVSVLLYDKTFKKLEDQIMERIKVENGETAEEEDGEEKIFSDAPIED